MRALEDVSANAFYDGREEERAQAGNSGRGREVTRPGSWVALCIRRLGDAFSRRDRWYVVGMDEAVKGAEEQGILEGLFASPPRSLAELRARLAPVEPAVGRQRLLARLAEVGAPPRDTATLVGALRALGLGEADVPALGALLLDASAEVSGRAVALALLSSLDSGRAQELARRLSPDDLMTLNDAQLTTVIAAMPTTPDRVIEIAQKLARQPAESRPLRFAQIERIRRRLGIPAALLYRDALGHETVGLDGPILDLVVEEGGEGAMIRITELWQASPGAEAQARWATALGRLHQVEGRATVEIRRGEAFIGRSPEGVAAVILSLTSVIDGSFTLASAQIGEDAPILTGSVASLSSQRDLDELLAGIRAVEETSLAEAGARVEAAARDPRAGGKMARAGFAVACFFALARRIEV
jgi:hypothetical protein